MAHADDPRSTDPSDPTGATAGPGRSPRSRPPWATGMICVTILPLLGFIGQSGRTLWGEYAALRGDRSAARTAAVVGYLGIHPRPSYAGRPDDWKHDEGGRTLLWAGWADGENRWYRFDRGELEGLRLSYPMGRDAILAIDRPIYQRRGEAFWAKVPDEALVAPLDLGGGPTAYPIRVLDKVEVVNGLDGDRPIVVAFSPTSLRVAVYDATVDGRRVTMGHSGFFEEAEPVLYDRGTESLWAARGDGLAAVAGARKGASLRRIARIEAVAWGDWRAEHPAGRLLIGADRSVAKPAE